MGIFRGIFSVINNRKRLSRIAAKIKQNEPLSLDEFNLLHSELVRNIGLVRTLLQAMGYEKKVAEELRGMTFERMTMAQTLFLNIQRNEGVDVELLQSMKKDEPALTKLMLRIIEQGNPLTAAERTSLQKLGGTVPRTKLRL